jgi:sporulation protein YabP
VNIIEGKTQAQEENRMKEKNISLQPKTNHSIIMENRRTMNISGITDVDSFDEKTIVLFTQLGELTIKGRELHIDSMSVETGDMVITGDIWSAVYGDRDRKKPVSAIGRLFR